MKIKLFKNKFLKPFILKGKSCLDCETVYEKEVNFCPNCGQKNKRNKLSIKDFISEFLASFYAFDSKLWNSITLLFFKPGKLTLEYIQGKRTRNVNPFKFYFHVTVVFFLLQGVLTNNVNKTNSSDLSEIKINYEDLEIESLKDVKYSKLYQYLKETYEKDPQKAFQAIGEKPSGNDIWIYEKMITFKKINDNPQNAINYLISKIPMVLFIFLPIFTFFLGFLYIRRNQSYMEHLIFVFHVQSVLFIGMSISIILSHIFNFPEIYDILLVLFLIYLFFAMKRFYKQKKWKTLFKLILANILYVVLASIGLVLSVIISLEFY